MPPAGQVGEARDRERVLRRFNVRFVQWRQCGDKRPWIWSSLGSLPHLLTTDGDADSEPLRVSRIQAHRNVRPEQHPTGHAIRSVRDRVGSVCAARTVRLAGNRSLTANIDRRCHVETFDVEALIRFYSVVFTDGLCAERIWKRAALRRPERARPT
jgi:hypothetical protein